MPAPTIAEIVSGAKFTLQEGKVKRKFQLHINSGFEPHVTALLESNGGTRLLNRICRNAIVGAGSRKRNAIGVRERLENPFRVQPHYSVSAKKVPVEAVKPYSNQPPRHVNANAVHVYHMPGDDPVEQLRFFEALWKREKQIGLKPGQRTRTAVPFFALVEVGKPGARPLHPLQFLVSVQSKLQSFQEHLDALAAKQRPAVWNQFMDFFKDLQARGIKPGTTSPRDYFVHVESTPSGNRLKFILISPRGGTVFNTNYSKT